MLIYHLAAERQFQHLSKICANNNILPDLYNIVKLKMAYEVSVVL